MAEEQQNKNSKGIGELFVEFGTKGFPTILKQLNGISASFLLGKNAAGQFAQTLIQPAKKAGETVTEWRKLNNELGLSYDRIQSMQVWAKKYGISDSIFGDISGIVDVLTQFRKYGVLPSEWYEAFRLLQQAGGLNLDISQYENTAEGAIRLLNDIGIGLKNINDLGLKRNILQNFGVSLEALDYLKQGKINYQEMINIGQKEIEQLQKQKEAVGELEVAWERVWLRLVAISSIKLTPLLNTTADVLTPAAAEVKLGTILAGGIRKTKQEFDKAEAETGAEIRAEREKGHILKSELKAIKFSALVIPKIIGSFMSGSFNTWKEGRKGNNNSLLLDAGQFAPPTEVLEYPPDLDRAGLSNLSTDGIPTDVSHLISSVTNLNLDAKIYVNDSDNPRAIGQGIREELLAQAQYNTIQNRNMTDV